MKLILSRKGVDSSAGGFASPIFPDGRLISIPIPDNRSHVRYRDIHTEEDTVSIGKLVKDLSRDKLKATHRVHVDPDLERASLPREPGWRPLFGQCGAAQSHLQSLGVGSGDLFLFFGWFRRVESYRRRWRYVADAPDLHVLYGWMQIHSVEAVDKIQQLKKYSWAHYHPHCFGRFSGSNVIYTGSKKLDLFRHRIPGVGLFDSYNDALCLTDAGRSRSRWRLPQWMHPEGRDSTLSYHSDFSRWQKSGEHALLQSAARGQEFVLDLDDYPEGVDWIRGLISRAAT